MSTKIVLVVISTVLIAACASPERRRAERDAALVEHVCGMPEAERQAELERLRKESGMMIYCARKEPDSPPAEKKP